MGPLPTSLTVCIGSVAGLREQRLAGYVVHATGPPETGHSSLAPYAAIPPVQTTVPLALLTEGHSADLTATPSRTNRCSIKFKPHCAPEYSSTNRKPHRS